MNGIAGDFACWPASKRGECVGAIAERTKALSTIQTPKRSHMNLENLGGKHLSRGGDGSRMTSIAQREKRQRKSGAT